MIVLLISCTANELIVADEMWLRSFPFIPDTIVLATIVLLIVIKCDKLMINFIIFTIFIDLY